MYWHCVAVLKCGNISIPSVCQVSERPYLWNTTFQNQSARWERCEQYPSQTDLWKLLFQSCCQTHNKEGLPSVSSLLALLPVSASSRPPLLFHVFRAPFVSPIFVLLVHVLPVRPSSPAVERWLLRSVVSLPTGVVSDHFALELAFAPALLPLGQSCLWFYKPE